MRKRFVFKSIILLLMLALMIVFFACEKTEKFNITYIAGDGGKIIGDLTQTIARGADATSITAVADEGYTFIGWSDGEKNETRQDVNITAPIAVTAEFVRKSFTVIYIAGIGGKIVGGLTQTIDYGANGTSVTAEAFADYEFVRWSDGETEPTRQEMNVTEAKTIIAEFETIIKMPSGTEDDPYIIKDYLGLLDMKARPSAFYVLGQDLDLFGVDYSPLFDSNKRFEGSLDGNGYTIKNLTIDKNVSFPSLLGFIGERGVVKDLNMTNATIAVPNFYRTDYLYVGALAGVSFGRLENINITASISGIGIHYDGVAIGGLIGQSYGDITNCHVDIDLDLNDIQTNETKMFNPFSFGGLVGVSSSNIYECNVVGSMNIEQSYYDVIVGGLVGYYFIDEDIEKTISKCTTNVLMSNDHSIYIAGFICELNPMLRSIRINDCAVKGDIVDALSAAGFIHKSENGNVVINNCCVENNISTSGRATGFIGRFYDGEIINCYFEGNITANSYAIGFFDIASNATIIGCHAIGNMSADYAIGFAFAANKSKIEKCFALGTAVFGTGGGYGFIVSSGGSSIVNCYSTIDISNFSTEYQYSGITMVGFVYNCLINSEVRNCYYGGRISFTGEYSEIYSKIFAFSLTVYNSTIENCHTLLPQDSIIIDTFGTNQNSEIEIIEYETFEEMYNLADTLNTENEPIWENVTSDLPKLIGLPHD